MHDRPLRAFARVTLAALLAGCAPRAPLDERAPHDGALEGGPDADTTDADTTDADTTDADTTDAGTTDAGPSPQDAATGPRCPELPAPGRFDAARRPRLPLDDTLRVHHLQAKATHNSYHLRPESPLVEWDYEHAPLGEQLERQGVRSVELDLNFDARCGRLEVYHVRVLDERTSCRLFTDCLLALRTFSEGHPGHQPLMVHLEPKGAEGLWDEARFALLEREILSVFDRGWIITPDEVRGELPTLREAITTRGWPTLGATRGRVLFYLDDSGAPRAVYTRGGRDLQGRLLFVDSDPTDPFAGVVILNDPISNAMAITSALTQGFLVRTRADSNPVVARTNDRTQAERALASGAQLVSTDFPAPIAGSMYSVAIPGGSPSRCNPVTAPPQCTSAAIEDPTRLTP